MPSSQQSPFVVLLASSGSGELPGSSSGLGDCSLSWLQLVVGIAGHNVHLHHTANTGSTAGGNRERYVQASGNSDTWEVGPGDPRIATAGSSNVNGVDADGIRVGGCGGDGCHLYVAIFGPST